MKRHNKIFLLLSLLITIMLLGVGTYAWIARSWTPQLEYPQVSIATTGALIISFEDENGEESIYNEVDVNELMGFDTFALKQVSSVDGKYFVSANFNPILDGGVPIYDENTQGKYIETEFWIKTQYENDEDLREKKKEVFLHSDSYIIFNPSNENEESKNVDLAIRVSLELENINNGVPLILCNDRGTEDGAIDNKYDNSLFGTSLDAVGKNIFTDYPSDTSLANGTYQTQKVYKLNYFDGSSTDNVLFTIDAASIQKVTLRIWLEGCDEYCVNEIAGKNLSILLKFDSREVLTENQEIEE